MLILALSGSLRALSLNTAMLEAARQCQPDGVVITPEEALCRLPLSSPGLDDHLPPDVIAFRKRVAAADGLLIACPDDAGGIPGAFKNALDWLVGCPDFNARPVALINVALQAEHAEAALRRVLATLSAPVIDAASRRIPIRDRNATVETLLADPEVMTPLAETISLFRDARLQRASPATAPGG